MSKTIKSLLLISILLFALLQSASSQNLRRLQEIDSDAFDLVGTEAETTPKPTETSEDRTQSEPTPTTPPAATGDDASFSLGEDEDSTAANPVSPTPPTPTITNAVSTTTEAEPEKFDLEGDETVPTKVVDPAPTDVGTQAEDSFVLGDEEETKPVSNTQNNAAPPVPASTEPEHFDLDSEDSVGAPATQQHAANSETTFDLEDKEDNEQKEVRASDSVDLGDAEDNTTPVGAANNEVDTAFDLDEKDANDVDLTDPADAADSTDKNSASANNGGRNLASTATLVTGAVKSGVSLQTGMILSLVAAVSALFF